jgi:cell division protein FtsZ
MDEISIVTNYIIQKAERDVNIIWGYVKDSNLVDEIGVTLIATGFEMNSIPEFIQPKPLKVRELDAQANLFDAKSPQSQMQTHTLDVNSGAKSAIQTEIDWNQLRNRLLKIYAYYKDSEFNGPHSLQMNSH